MAISLGRLDETSTTTDSETVVATSGWSKAISYVILAVLMCGVVWFLYHNT